MSTLFPPLLDAFAVILKALGVAFVCETAADICRDMGQTAIASKIELAGKLEIVALAIPLARELLLAARELAG